MEIMLVMVSMATAFAVVSYGLYLVSKAIVVSANKAGKATASFAVGIEQGFKSKIRNAKHTSMEDGIKIQNQ